jgi:cation diffusion facilitator family transporter
LFTRKTKAAAVSIASNTILILLKLVSGVITGSVSLIAEAIHSLMDLAAAIVAFVSVNISDRPADREHPFGHGKAENISGVIEGLLIFVAAGFIIYEAVHRIIVGEELEFLELGIGLMVVSIVVNTIVSRYLRRTAKSTDSLALEADATHLTTDVLTMVGVLVGLIVVRITGLTILDPIIAILVALIIIKAAFDITKKSFGGLMDASLPEVEESAIKSCLAEHSEIVVGFHKLRTRKVGSFRQIDLHLVIPKALHVDEAHQICEHLERHIEGILESADVTIHVEPCGTECYLCTTVCDARNRED